MTLRDEFYDGRCGTAIHPWEYPDCENCGVEIYVVLGRGEFGDRYRCTRCGNRFRPPDFEIRKLVMTAKERQKRTGRQ